MTGDLKCELGTGLFIINQRRIQSNMYVKIHKIVERKQSKLKIANTGTTPVHIWKHLSFHFKFLFLITVILWKTLVNRNSSIFFLYLEVFQKATVKELKWQMLPNVNWVFFYKKKKKSFPNPNLICIIFHFITIIIIYLIQKIAIISETKELRSLLTCCCCYYLIIHKIINNKMKLACSRHMKIHKKWSRIFFPSWNG